MIEVTEKVGEKSGGERKGLATKKQNNLKIP